MLPAICKSTSLTWVNVCYMPIILWKQWSFQTTTSVLLVQAIARHQLWNYAITWMIHDLDSKSLDTKTRPWELKLSFS